MFPSSEQFSGKVFLVTGASSGIGETLVLMLASKGASVTLCGQNEERLESVRQRCVTESGGHAERFAAACGDIQKADVRKQYIQTAIDKFGKLDVLVSNAGRNGNDLGIFTATEKSYDLAMKVNVKAAFFMIQNAVPYLEKTKGCIVCVSSIFSTMSVPGNAIYPMTKAALDHMTRCLALDLAPKGIRVNTVNPSFVLTRILRFVGDDAANDAANLELAAVEIPLQPLEGRLVTTEEVANAVIFLASDSASFITGQSLQVDGGRILTGPLKNPPKNIYN